MEQNVVENTLTIRGMSCPNCEIRIENKLKTILGVLSVKAKYTDECVNLTFDSSKASVSEIIGALESLDYSVKSIDEQHTALHNKKTALKGKQIIISLGVIAVIVATILIIRSTVGLDLIRNIDPSMGYGILLVIGLINSLHCITMCGGINLSLCVAYKSKSENKAAQLLPSLLYNSGRVISYTIIGGIVGTLGSVINISSGTRGVGAIIAGTFMVLMGLNMLNVFPGLRKIVLKMPKIFGNAVYSGVGSKGPFIVGLLNGLMPCGSLQTMQLYALGTGSFISAALSMFFFSLGTVPLMFSFGAVSSMLSKRFTANMMKMSAVLVMSVGAVMFIMGIAA